MGYVYCTYVIDAVLLERKLIIYMGKYSRDKGSRVERELVRRLIEEGYDAYRVPFSGAMSNHTASDKERYSHDVIAKKDGRTYKFEVKARGGTQFDILHKALIDQVAPSFSRFGDPLISGVCFGYSLQQVLNIVYFYSIKEEQKKLYKRLLSFRPWLGPEEFGSTQILAVKSDREPFIFIRYI